jgi:hypothetical protein
MEQGKATLIMAEKTTWQSLNTLGMMRKVELQHGIIIKLKQPTKE